MDAAQFRVAGKQLVDYIADYLETIATRPVLPSVEPFYLRDLVPDKAPEDGEPWSNIFSDIERAIMPGVSSIRVSLRDQSIKGMRPLPLPFPHSQSYRISMPSSLTQLYSFCVSVELPS